MVLWTEIFLKFLFSIHISKRFIQKSVFIIWENISKFLQNSDPSLSIHHQLAANNFLVFEANVRKV